MLAPAPSPSSLVPPASPRSFGSGRTRSRSASIFVNTHLDSAGLTHLIEFREKKDNRKEMATIFGAFAGLIALCVAQGFFFLVTAVETRRSAEQLRHRFVDYRRQEPLAQAVANERTFTWLYLEGDRWVNLGRGEVDCVIE